MDVLSGAASTKTVLDMWPQHWQVILQLCSTLAICTSGRKNRLVSDCKVVRTQTMPPKLSLDKADRLDHSTAGLLTDQFCNPSKLSCPDKTRPDKRDAHKKLHSTFSQADHNKARVLADPSEVVLFSTAWKLQKHSLSRCLHSQRAISSTNYCKLKGQVRAQCVGNAAERDAPLRKESTIEFTDFWLMFSTCLPSCH